MAATKVSDEIDFFQARLLDPQRRQLRDDLRRARLYRRQLEEETAPGSETPDPQVEAITKEEERLRDAAKAAGAFGPYAQDFLIVTLPDPQDANLAREFDLLVDALRKSFEDHEFMMDRFWLPWSQDPKTSSANAAANLDVQKSTAASGTAPGPSTAQRKEPGVLLFRDDEGQRLFAVLIVGETPTWGIQKNMLLTALDVVTRETASTDNPQIRLIGPVYSGSALSLHHTLREWLASPYSPRNVTIEITSGTATRERNCKIIRDGLESRIKYTTVATMDQRKQTVLYAYLQERLHIEPSDIALLVESSAFGSTFVKPMAVGSKSEERELYLPFPMHISQTRTERARWEAEQRASNEKSAKLGGKYLELDLAGSTGNLATPRPFAPLLTSRTAEMTLSRIINKIALDERKAVGIIATDIRDQLFLAKAVRQQLPDVHLFSFEGDTLLAHPDYSAACRGMIVASSSNFEHSAGTQHTLFPSDRANGLFRAVSRELDRSGDSSDSSTQNPEKPVWIHIVGRGDLWPISAQPQTLLRATRPKLQNDHGWFVVMLTASALLLIASFRTLEDCREYLGSWLKKLKARFRDASDAASAKAGELAAKDFLVPVMFGGLCLILSTPFLLKPTAGTHQSQVAMGLTGGFPQNVIWTLMLSLPVILSIILAAFLVKTAEEVAARWRSNEPPYRSPGVRRIQGAVLLLVGPLVGIAIVASPIAVSVSWISRLQSFGDAFLLRSSTVLSGVSPIIPLAFLSGIPLVWAVARRYRRLRRSRIGEAYYRPAPADDATTSPDEERIEKPDEEGAEKPSPERVFWILLADGYYRNWIVGLLFIIMVLAPLFNASGISFDSLNWRDVFILKGYEEVPLDEIASVLFIFGVVYLFVCWIRVLRGWWELRSLLRSVHEVLKEKTPNHTELCQSVGDDRKSSPIWVDTGHCEDSVIASLKQHMEAIGSDPSSSEGQEDLPQKICVNTATISRTALGLLRRDLIHATIIGLLLLAALVAYPYQPNRFLISWVASLVGLVALGSAVIIPMMDRDPVLSGLFTPKAEKVSWSGGLAGGLASFSVVPLLAVTVSQYPGLQELLLSWLGPILRFFNL